MKKGLTELVFILDRSGSMGGLEEDTIGGFNSMLKKQKAESGEALVSTVLFDHEQQVLYDRTPIAEVPEMTAQQYYVRGSTALLDALGGAIHHIGNVHRYARDEDVPEKTLFIITTDGMENASREYTSEKVKAMVEREQKEYGWEFLFLGANIDAIRTAGSYGIRPEHAVNFENDRRGTRLNYEAVSAAISSYRQCDEACPSAIPKNWKEKIERDYRARHRK